MNELNTGVNGQVQVILTVPTDPREQVNFHNIWIGVACEPQDAGANAQGTWALLIRRLESPGKLFSDVNVNAENFNAITVACGVWSASNETPFNLPATQIKTSRNLNAGDSLELVSISTGITAGLVSNRVMLCAHTTRA